MSACRTARWLGLLAGASVLAWTATAQAQSAPSPANPPASAPDDGAVVTVVADKAGLLERRPNMTVLGLTKPLIQTPRAASLVSDTTLERYGIQTVDDLVSVSPSTYTASFYGIAGALDVRGTLADNYFEGFKLIQDEGTYTTPIGDASQIEIVRGPPSPIYGPGEVGGFLNFIPKSAKSEGLTHPVGEIEATLGSYDKKNLNAQFGAPVTLGTAQGGIYAYGEIDDSGSFYEGIHPEHELGEVSVSFDLPNRWSFSADGLIYGSTGDVQTAGWNRVTQQLINNQTYVTGRNTSLANTPGVPYLTPAQATPFGGPYPFNFTAVGGGLYAFYSPSAPPLGLPPMPDFQLDSPGAGTTVKLSPRDVDVGPADFSDTLTGALVVGLTRDFANDSTLRLQVFYDGLDNRRFVSYGFPAWFRANVYEGRATYDFKLTGFDGEVTADTIVGASYRSYQGRDMQSFNSGLIALDRRDLSVGATPTDTICDPFTVGDSNDEVPANCQGWENDIHSTEGDAGVFATTDITIGKRLDIILGGRLDEYDVRSIDTGILSFDAAGEQSASKGDPTYSASISYQLPFGLMPYLTYAQTASLSTQQAGDVRPSDIASGGWIARSDLTEAGIKFQLLNHTLVGSLDAYSQDRTELTGLNAVTERTRSSGEELEVRWLATKNLSFTFSGNLQHTEVIGPNTADYYIPAYAVCGANLACELNSWGGAYLAQFNTLPGRGGNYALTTIPDAVASLHGSYITDEHDWGRLGVTAGVTYVSQTSGTIEHAVVYPAYALVDASAFYQRGPYEVDLNVTNLLNKLYFTPNTDPTYVNVSVLPGVGQEWRLTLKRKF